MQLAVSVVNARKTLALTLLTICSVFNIEDAAASETSPGDGDAEGSEEARQRETDLTLVPVAGGDSDTGFGGGFIASIARTGPDVEPYHLRLESAGMITFRPAGDDLQIPFLDGYLLLDAPHVIEDQLGIKLRVSHTHEEGLRYFGLGNASRLDPGTAPDDPRYRYDRTHPTFDIGFEYALGGHWKLIWGAALTYNEVSVPNDGVLAEDAAAPDPDVRRLTQIVPRHWVGTFRYGIGWDTRDDEVSPARGQLHTVRVDLSPGAPDIAPYSWVRVNLAARGYVPLVRKRLTLALRLVGDSLLGTPPFYELARYDNTYALGGSKGVRGIPARRYHGKLKVFSNVEVRWEAFDFDLFDKPYRLGIVAFVDSGRVWADYARLSELDGSGFGVKIGYGGGLRLAAGETFVLRTDLATSPEEGKLSAYLTAGHIF